MESTKVTSTEIVSLESISGGAAVERFGLLLQDVLNNIIDPNTDAKKTRSINLKFSVKPDETREFCSVEISSEAKLAPISPIKTQLFIGRDTRSGSGVACERSTRQADMFTPTPLPENVTPITKEAMKQ